MNRKITLTKADLEVCKAFAIATCDAHQSKGRDRDQKIYNITQGKLGEIAFYRLFQEQVEVPPSLIPSTVADPGYDIVMKSGNTIDVKTIQRFGKYVSFNKNRVYADRYAIMEFDWETLECVYIGIRDKEYMQKHGRKSKYQGHYIAL